MSSVILLAAVGNVLDDSTWSGIPYHMLSEAQRQGLDVVGLPTQASGVAWSARRVLWNLASVSRGYRLGGFQFSELFLQALWRQVNRDLRHTTIVNCFQLYPQGMISDRSINKWYFIDQTLRQLFLDYRLGMKLGRRTVSDAITREKVGYEASTRIVTHSRWAAMSLVQDYGIPPQKISIIVPGANLDHDAYALWEKSKKAPGPGECAKGLKLVFVGKEWHRKGLDRLLLALRIGRERGLCASLRVIGCDVKSLPIDLRATPGVQWCGFVSKRAGSSDFISLVSECDVGCLLSRAEAGGIVLREFQALGLAALATDVGGISDHVCRDAAVLIPPDASPEAIASHLLALETNRSYLSRLRVIAFERRAESLWANSMGKLWNLMSNLNPAPSGVMSATT